MKNFQAISLFFFVSLFLVGQQEIAAIGRTHQTAEIQQVESDANEAHYPSSRGLLNSIHSEAESSVLSLHKLAELQTVNDADERDKQHALCAKSAESDKNECYLAHSNYLTVSFNIRQILFPFHSFP